MTVNLFDANFYRVANRDLASFNDAQALSHFQTYGLSEGRAFSPFVDLNFYRASNSDLGSFDNRQLFDHLQNYGIAEGRRFSPLVNLNFYRAYNSDLASFNNEQLFDHLHKYALSEGRRFSPLVDLNFYRTYNSDLASFNNEQLFDHLLNYGETEGRRFSPFIDLNIYRVANPDLSAKRFDNKQLLEHLISYGIGEGRRYSVSFDSNYYRNANPDLASLNNSQLLQHFGRYGLAEGRASSESFNVQFYLNYNTDLKAAFDYQQAQQHFEIYGFREGRTGAPPREILPTEPDNTLNTAFNLGILNRQSSIKGFVGANDRDDYMAFTLATTSEFNLNLSSDRAYADIIFDANGNGQYDTYTTIAPNGAFVTSEEDVASTYTISGSQPISKTLGAGTYYIHVYTDASASDSNYTLNLSASPTPSTLPTDPGDSLNTAYDLDLTSGTSNVSREFIGTSDKDDYYRFTLTDTTNISLDFSGFTEPITAGLYYDLYGNGYINLLPSLDGNDFIAGYNSDNPNPISETLGAGTYYIHVYSISYSNSFNTPTNTTNYSSSNSINYTTDNSLPDYYTNYTSSNTNYNLSLSATPTTTKPSIPDPGDTLSTAYNVGLLSGDRNFTQYVGVVDKVDYYRFTLDHTSNVNFNLNSLNDRADLLLIYDSNSNSQIDFGEFLTPTDSSSSPKSFSKTLNAGTYYLEVLEYSSQFNTFYTLDLSAT